MPKESWWKSAVVYQVFPLSFQDTNGDGFGDLKGIGRRLDYLAWLGVDAIWITPVYVSPLADSGYDIADYCEIDPVFGSMADFDDLVQQVHAIGMRLILDFVPNHTSDRHGWFAESRSSRASAKRDWYIWCDPAVGGGPPNNWASNFGGSAWAWDEATEQYYYHVFLKQQPDLNWRNPAVRNAMMDVLRFWARKGVDGFRVDAVTHLAEDSLLRDNPPALSQRSAMPRAGQQLQVFNSDRPEAHEFIAEMRATVDEFPDRVLIGEVHLPVARAMSYYGEQRPGFNLPFNFELLHTPWNARSLEAAIDQYMTLLPRGAWPNWVLGNHDEHRIATRIGAAQARIAAMLLLTLPGTPFMYNGDELGMTDVHIPPGRAWDLAGMMGDHGSRDPQRTPIPWDGSPHAGFTDGEPWLPMSEDIQTQNVACERADPGSMLTLYHRILSLRRSVVALRTGSYRPVADHGTLLCYERYSGRQRVFVALNCGSDEQDGVLPAPGRILVSTHLDRKDEVLQRAARLRANEGLILELRT